MVSAMARRAKIDMASRKCHFLQLLFVNLLLLTQSFQKRGPLHAIQFAALLRCFCSGVIVLRFTRRKLRDHTGLALPHSSVVFSIITIWMMFYLLRSHTADRWPAWQRRCRVCLPISARKKRRDRLAMNTNCTVLSIVLAL